MEYIDDRWYMRHDKKYILVWVLFFAVKLLITQILKLITGSAMPFWHMILYFCFYYPWRTINVFIANPDMRKAVLKKKACIQYGKNSTQAQNLAGKIKLLSSEHQNSKNQLSAMESETKKLTAA